MPSSNSLLIKISLVVIIFASASLWMLYLSFEATKLLQSEAYLSKNESLNFPTNIEELKSISSLLKASYSKNAQFILLLYSSAYLYKQSFAIPGSVFLNLLAGSLFGLYKGLAICCLLSTMGALGCFFLSKLCGEAAVKRFFANKLTEIRLLTNRQGTMALLSYLISVRLFPASPNWLINILCPIVGVPWYLFAISVSIGLMPYIYLCVQTGEILSEISSPNDMFTPSILIKSTAVALVALLPPIFMRIRNRPKQE